MEDNEPVVSMMVELHRLVITKHLPTVQGWVQVRTHTDSNIHSPAISLGTPVQLLVSTNS